MIRSDSHSLLKALAKIEGNLNNLCVQQIFLILRNCKLKKIDIRKEWIPGHAGIDGNNQADVAIYGNIRCWLPYFPRPGIVHNDAKISLKTV